MGRHPALALESSESRLTFWIGSEGPFTRVRRRADQSRQGQRPPPSLRPRARRPQPRRHASAEQRGAALAALATARRNAQFRREARRSRARAGARAEQSAVLHPRAPATMPTPATTRAPPLTWRKRSRSPRRAQRRSWPRRTLIHSRYVARHVYSLTEEPRFAWILVFIALIWATSYAAGLPDLSGRLSRHLARALPPLVAADVIISVLQLFTGAQLLPRFVVFVGSGAASAGLRPGFAALDRVTSAYERARTAWFAIAPAKRQSA